jgi:vancomycin resistance protein YoaR
MRTKYFKILTISIILICMLTSTPSLHADTELITISSYTTSVQDQDFNVKTNIALAAGKLNGFAVMPGEVFSFNKVVGEGSAGNGFLTGRVLYQDAAAYESGGGICQVSSTLFNAMLLSGFTVSERHRHSRPVRYVPLGLDATIRYGKKDLRMKNQHSHPIYIFTTMNDRSLTILIKSERNLQNLYEVVTEEEEVNLPFANDENKTIRPGISIYVYRKRIQGKNIIESHLLYKDFYPPVNVER